MTHKSPRYSRHIIDDILKSCHKSCDEADLETAMSLLSIVERILTRRPIKATHDRRRHMEAMIAAHTRLWFLRQEDAELQSIGMRARAA